MPKAKNGDINIYYEVEGEGPPLVLHHGLTGCLDTWRILGQVDELKNDYQLILMDARGHGKSDKPHDSSAYTMEHRVGDVTAVLDDLDISSPHFYGYSYGGQIAFELAKIAPERARSLIIGGAGAKGRKPDDPTHLGVIQLLEAGPEALVARFEQGGPMPPGIRAGLMANDFEALIAICNSSAPDLSDDLSKMTMPFLLFAGESDPAFPAMQEASKNLPDVTFFSLPGLNHVQAAFRSDLVLPHVKEFLARVSRV